MGGGGVHSKIRLANKVYGRLGPVGLGVGLKKGGGGEREGEGCLPGHCPRSATAAKQPDKFDQNRKPAIIIKTSVKTEKQQKLAMKLPKRKKSTKPPNRN